MTLVNCFQSGTCRFRLRHAEQWQKQAKSGEPDHPRNRREALELFSVFWKNTF